MSSAGGVIAVKSIRKQLTFANVVACLALFVALGGASYAATQLPKNSVGSLQIKKDAVTGAKVKDGSLRAADFRAGQIPAGPARSTGPAGPQGVQGLRGEQGEQGVEETRGPSDAYYAFHNPASVDEKELTLWVPAGSYVVNGSMGAASDDAGDFASILCFLSNTNIDSGDIGEAELTIGPVANGSVEYGQATVQAAFSTGADGGTITFYCEKFAGDAEVNLRRAQINAIKVEALHP
jgi:hypothetical protein